MAVSSPKVRTKATTFCALINDLLRFGIFQIAWSGQRIFRIFARSSHSQSNFDGAVLNNCFVERSRLSLKVPLLRKLKIRTELIEVEVDRNAPLNDDLFAPHFLRRAL